MLLKDVSPVNLTYHGQSHFNSLVDEKNPLPLCMRDTKVLLKSRVALFEEFLSSNSTKTSPAAAQGEADSQQQQQQQQQQLQPTAENLPLKNKKGSRSQPKQSWFQYDVFRNCLYSFELFF